MIRWCILLCILTILTILQTSYSSCLHTADVKITVSIIIRWCILTILQISYSSCLHTADIKITVSPIIRWCIPLCILIILQTIALDIGSWSVISSFGVRRPLSFHIWIQMNRTLTGSIYWRSSIKFFSDWLKLNNHLLWN